jgi:putative ABC transport system permease protein
MENLLHDLRFGIRLLAKKPVFTMVAVITLALGIGVNTTAFSIVNAVLRKRLPVPEPDRVVNVYDTDAQNPEHAVSYPDYLYYRERNQVFSSVLALSVFKGALTSAGQLQMVFGELVSGNYFQVLGVKPALGRWFSSEEDEVPNRNPVAVISYSLWERFFNRDPHVIGKVVKLNGYNFTVVGVAPAEFNGLILPTALTTDIWVPLNMAAQIGESASFLSDRNERRLQLVGRLKPRVTIEQAEAALTLVKRQLEQAHPDIKKDHRDHQIKLVPAEDVLFDPSSDKRLLALGGGTMTVVGLVLLIACTNLANLLLAQAASRAKEMAVRLALGASRGRLIRQLLTESLILSFLGGAAGLLLAYWLAQIVVTLLPVAPVHVSMDVSIDTRVLIFTLLVCLLTGIVCGLAPAMQASKTNLTNGLTGEGVVAPRGRRFGMRHGLIVPQVALSLLLLLMAGLFLRSLYKAESTELGFETEHAAMIELDLKLHGHQEARGREFYRTLLERARHLPGVASASLIDSVPLESQRAISVSLDGRLPTSEQGLFIPSATISPGFLKTIGIPLVRGRDLTEYDTQAAPRVALLNEAAARKLWPGQEPLGKQLFIHTQATPQLVEVVGIVKDTKVRFRIRTPTPYLYVPWEQHYLPRMKLIVSCPGDSASLLEPLRKLVRELDPTMAIVQSKTMSNHIASFFYPMRFVTALSASLGFLGLLLASVGIYGVIAYSVAQRTKEIGLRMALGAQRADVLRLVITEGLKMVALGSVVGLCLAVATTRVLSSFLFGISVTDPVTFVGVPLIFTGVALLACYVPARKALRVDPMTALRYE